MYSVSLDKITTIYPFLEIIKLFIGERLKHPKASVLNLLWKLIGNSLYEQLATGLNLNEDLKSNIIAITGFQRTGFTTEELKLIVTKSIKSDIKLLPPIFSIGFHSLESGCRSYTNFKGIKLEHDARRAI